MRRFHRPLAVLGLATAMHVDWHLARPAVHHLSFGLSWHWLFALPVFALTALYVRRVAPDPSVVVSIWLIGVAAIIAAVIEPMYEYYVGGATVEWAFGRTRLVAFAQFTAVGVVTHALVLALTRPRHVDAVGV